MAYNFAGGKTVHISGTACHSSGDFAIGGWVYLSTTGVSNYLLAGGDIYTNTVPGIRLNSSTTNYYVRLQHDDEVGAGYNHTITPQTGVWQYTILNHKDGVRELWVDESVASGAFDISDKTMSQSNYYFGQSEGDPYSPAKICNAKLASWCKWDTALTSGEIAELRGGSHPLTVGTNHSWYMPFNRREEPSGITAVERGYFLPETDPLFSGVSTTPTSRAVSTATDITAEALRSLSSGVRPLPLLSAWNSTELGWSPSYQFELLQSGIHLLPWFTSPERLPANTFDQHYGLMLPYCSSLNLPITIVALQWEDSLRAANTGNCVLTSTGIDSTRLSCFGPVENWSGLSSYVETADFTRIQEMYPDPPLVLLFFNNEASVLKWTNITNDVRYVNAYSGHPSYEDPEFQRSIVASGWIERYNTMFSGIRAALSENWQTAVKFVGYDAFGPPEFGRHATWQNYELVTDDFLTPDFHCWDGGSPSYYTHNWDATTDYTWWSTQAGSNNLIFALDEALEINPNYWFEMSTWDGNYTWYPGQPSGNDYNGVLPQAIQYEAVGQDYTEDRYEGWMQFGLWLCRPKCMREWRAQTVAYTSWASYWARYISLIEKVWDSEKLRNFWRNGTLVANPNSLHPYQTDIPTQYANAERWYTLDTSVMPSKPWTVSPSQTVKVWACAYELGTSPNRQWLIYAHAPISGETSVSITIPGYGNIVKDVSRQGNCYYVYETIQPPPNRFVSSVSGENTLSMQGEVNTVVGSTLVCASGRFGHADGHTGEITVGGQTMSVVSGIVYSVV